MPQSVPIRPVPNQTLTIQLGGQNCQLNIYQQLYGLFMDVYVNNVLIIGGVICENLNRIVRDSYLGFLGDFTFVDTTSGESDPGYTGLGSRYLLIYLAESELQ
jgi:hypothetical protein